ncbi:hypothetical protein OG589_10040 [Sphaerisporangium sp. NBC_01403]|uniref:hypothetical protein n=1 Tax=Sphaerisporangium sp. NBC_01403 TaxID=2903599 RepID=UPI0032536226
MTTATESWGLDTKASGRSSTAYADAGGNFIDTATPIPPAVRRPSFRTRAGDVNAAGNHRKNLRQAVGASLRRLRTDHLDILWVHAREVE